MLNKIKKSEDATEEIYYACECICDDNGIHFVCSTCGKYYDDDFDALMCCISD